MGKISVCKSIFLFVLSISLAQGQTETFNYKKYIQTQSPTLSASTTSIDAANGNVTINGSDLQQPTTPFTFIWGDNTTTSGFFPQTHKYANTQTTYLAKVIANYSATRKDTADVFIGFNKPVIQPIALDSKLRVYIPASAGVVSTPTNLPPIPDEFFTGDFSRANAEYILSVIGTIEYDFANENVRLYNGKFEQYLLRDASFGGAYSMWFTSPATVGVGDGFLKDRIDFSALAHELGHNVTLNSPAQFIYGGKIDGQANAIFSETMAQIFQHAAGYEIVNNGATYGLDAVARATLEARFRTSFVGYLRANYDRYLTDKRFISWNDPATAVDEALPTFMTIAYKFCEYAERQNIGYRQPTKRLMAFLQRFNADWQRRYDQLNNNTAADGFRATLMVAALSHAFQKDLRADFRALNFPISDDDFAYLNPQLLNVSISQLTVNAVSAAPASVSIASTTSWTAVSSQPWLTVDAGSGTGNRTITLTAADNAALTARTATVTISSPGLINQVVTVAQLGAQATLTVSTTTLLIDATPLAPMSANVVSNTNWTVTGTPSWLTTTPTSGSGNTTISVMAAANSTSQARSATLTVSAGSVQRQIAVQQAGAIITANEDPLQKSVVLYPNPVCNELKVDGVPAGYDVRIYDLTGRQLLKQISTKSTLTIDTGALADGVYLLQAKGANQAILKRFVKGQ